IVEALTDNRNRTAQEVRHAFTRNGGTWGRPARPSGCSSARGSSWSRRRSPQMRTCCWTSRCRAGPRTSPTPSRRGTSSRIPRTSRRWRPRYAGRGSRCHPPRSRWSRPPRSPSTAVRPATSCS
ncbi:MAG: hypothetical protein E6G63_11010, partial [Actinobacteria bacterium]